MNILIVIYRSLGFGGAEVSTLEIAKYLQKKHNVIIASTEKYPEVKTIKFKKFHRIPIFQLQERYLKRFLNKLIKKHKIDLIVPQDRLTTIASIKAAQKNKIKCITHLRDYWPLCPRSSCLSPVGRRYEVCCSKIILSDFPLYRIPWDLYKWFYLKSRWKYLRKADKIIVKSKIEKERLKKIGIKNIEIITPTREPRLFWNVKHKNFEKKFKLKGTIVAFTGSFFHTKGIDLLIQIIPEIVNKTKDISFLLVGDGPMYDDIKRMIIKHGLLGRVIMTGRIPYSEIPKVYKAADIVLLPSQWEEPFSGIPLEAAAAGKPVIASNVGAMKDIHSKGIIKISPADDREKWINEIIDLSQNKKLRIKMGRLGHKYFMENYSPEIVMKKLEKVYTSL